MANRLAGETSPYLLEHADNPVDWYPWGDEALQKAQHERKPIMLSIGYSACHWCHVMARESFEDPETAALINRNFVPIKVDREERPDLDQVYMRAVQAMTGSGGWPMTVFLLPDGTPFFSGTYFPPAERHGMPSFRRVLNAVADAFASRPQEVETTAAEVRAFLQRPAVPLAAGTLSPALLDEAYSRLARDYDERHGGFGGAPKFPQPMLIDFLLRTHARTRQRAPLDMATHSLQAMADGGMYDQLGGGFHRYSVDERWLVPHFEKMLYDNALLPRAYLDAWQLTGNTGFRKVAEGTLGFVEREMTSPEGGFYSSLDADSQGEEGRFYLWTPDELRETLGEADAVRIGKAFDVTAEGNFEGRSILHPTTPAAHAILEEVRAPMFAARERRVRPHRDDKVIASWNGLMLRAFAEAGRVLERSDLIDVAQANAQFLLTRLRRGDRMLRSYKDGRASLPGFLEDHAAVIDGLLSLYEATFSRSWLEEARQLVSTMLDDFWNSADRLFFDSAANQQPLIVRPQDVTDNAIPSGTSMAVDVLLRAGRLLGKDQWVSIGRQVLERLAPTAAKAPQGFGRLLAALDFELGRPVELAVIGETASQDLGAFLDVVRSRYLPNRLVAAGPSANDGIQVPLLAGRHAIDGRVTAYLCEGFVCRAPTTDPHELQRQVEDFTGA